MLFQQWYNAVCVVRMNVWALPAKSRMNGLIVEVKKIGRSRAEAQEECSMKFCLAGCLRTGRNRLNVVLFVEACCEYRVRVLEPPQFSKALPLQAMLH